MFPDDLPERLWQHMRWNERDEQLVILILVDCITSRKDSLNIGVGYGFMKYSYFQKFYFGDI